MGGKDLAGILERNGWGLKRIHGNHHFYAKSGNPVRISIPVHGSNSLKIRLLRHLLKLAAIDEKDIQA